MLIAMRDRTWDVVWVGADLATFDPERGEVWGTVPDGALAVADGRIAWVGRRTDLPGSADRLAREVRDVGGAWITPGLIDCHTHLVHAGERVEEFTQRIEGRSYDEIARAGGGILRTVEATRAATMDALTWGAEQHLRALARDGVTTVEVKSGYDLTVEGELRMLAAARDAGDRADVEVRGTLLALHALPPEFAHRREDFVRLVVDEMLPAARARGLAHQVDAFLEDFAFTAEECEALFAAGRAHGFGLRLHADQRSASGGAALAGRWGAASADHLERCDAAGIEALAEGGSVAVLLPGAYLVLRDDRPPPVKGFRRAGVPMAVATDLNPGSSPVRSLRTAGSLACSLFGMTPAEALAGMTREAARALGLGDRGVLEVGRRADLAVWEVDRPEELVYWIGGDPLRHRVVGGELKPPNRPWGLSDLRS